MGDKLIMSKKERERKVVLAGYIERRYTLIEAAQHMSTSYRQAKRILRRYKLEGDVGLVHNARGNSSKRAFNREMKTAVLNLYLRMLIKMATESDQNDPLNLIKIATPNSQLPPL